MILDSKAPVVFDHLVEATFIKALKAQLNPALKQSLKEAGIDTGSKLLPAYPRSTWEKCLVITARELFPGRPLSESMSAIAESVIEHWRTTFIGKAVGPMLKLIGPRRTMLRANQNFRSVNNYTESRVREVSGSEYEIWLNEPGETRYFMQAILMLGLRETGVRAKSDVLEQTAEGTLYRISWS